MRQTGTDHSMWLQLLQRYQFRGFLLLSILCGLAAAHLAATGIGMLTQTAVAPPVASNNAPTSQARRPQLNDYLPILQRDIFNPDGGNLRFEKRQQQPAATKQAPSKWTLLGTISGGSRPLATLQAGGSSEIFALYEKLPDGAELVEIGRNRVLLRYPDGRSLSLEIAQEKLSGLVKPATTAPKRSGSSPRVEETGSNRWRIPQPLAENARNNIGDLLRQAQAIPYLENGKTTGFQIRTIQPGSLIAQLGLKQGDILREINGLPLNSPEKALQIFGQLRQARQVSVGLERRGKAMSFAYEIR